jgi:hypothetical protein
MYSDVWSLVEITDYVQMERWSVKNLIVDLELFVRTESVTAT